MRRLLHDGVTVCAAARRLDRMAALLRCGARVVPLDLADDVSIAAIDCLRMEVAPFGIRVVVIEPGAIRTEWGGIAWRGLLERSGRGAYAAWARRHAGMLARADRMAAGSEPDVVARTIAHAAAARRPRTRYASGGGAALVLAARRLLADRAFDRLMWAGSQARRNEAALDAAMTPAETARKQTGERKG